MSGSRQAELLISNSTSFVICVSPEKNLYFHGLGPRNDKPVIPRYIPDQRPASDIFRLSLDRSRSGSVVSPEVQLTPLFQDEGYTSSGKVAADETLAALIRTTTNWPSLGYRYDLVIRDLHTGTSLTIPPTDHLGFSRPVFVGNTLFVNEIFDNKYIIKRMLPGDTSPQLALEITDGSINHAPVIQIRVDDEVR